jgi:CP family cyanate transporter-like MFS transporter
VAGTLLPGLVKARFPDRIGPVTGLYTAGLIGGALLAAGTTEPMAAGGGVGWPGALALWAVPAAAALVLWLAVTRPVPTPTPPEARVGLPWRDRTAWLATAYMGGQSLLFYASLAWLAAFYTSLGVDATTAGLILAVFSATQLVSALGLPLLAHRGGRLGPWIALSVGLCIAGLALVAVVPLGSPWLWATILGLGMGGQFALALTLVAQIAPTPAAAPSYSGLAFLVGYVLAAVGPVAAGALRDLSGGYRAPFLALAGVGVVVLALGVMASRTSGATSP